MTALQAIAKNSVKQVGFTLVLWTSMQIINCSRHGGLLAAAIADATERNFANLSNCGARRVD